MFNSTVIHADFHPPSDIANAFLRRILDELHGLKAEGLTLTASALIFASILLYFLTGRRLGSKPSSSRIPLLRGLPIFGHWRFFNDRYAFVNEGMQKFGAAFQFNVLNVRGHYIVVSSLRCQVNTHPSLT